MYTQKKSRRQLVMLIMVLPVLSIGMFALSDDEETSITKDKLPTVIRQAIGDIEIDEIEMETENGETFYEVVFEVDEAEIELKLTADGRLVGIEIESEDDGDDDSKAGEADAAEETVSINEIPEAARAALVDLAEGTTIDEVEREAVNGVTLYEAKWQKQETIHEATVGADGTLIESEVTVSRSDLPKAVRQAVSKHFGNADDVTFERKTVVLYEAELETDDEEREVLLNPSGREVEVEVTDD